MVMPMGIDFTYSEVSAIIALIPFAMTSVSTSSMVCDVFVVTRDLEYPDSSMIFSMRALVELDTPSRPLMTFDTVAVETPASFAISLTRGFSYRLPSVAPFLPYFIVGVSAFVADALHTIVKRFEIDERKFLE